MTQNQENAPAVVSASSTSFNLIVTTSRKQANKIIKGLALTDPRFIDDISYLPSGGPKRGEALGRAIDDTLTIVSLIVIHDHAWVAPLLTDDSNMAPMVWRAIESAVLGHRTDSQRSLLVVSSEFDGSIDVGIADNHMRVFERGESIPSSWKQPRAVAPKSQTHGSGVKSEQQAPKKDAAKSPKTATVRPLPTAAAPQTNKPMSKVVNNKLKVRHVANAALYDDLYLLIKAEYGTFDYERTVMQARQTIAFHIGGRTDRITDEILVTHLVKAFTTKASKTTWRAFELIVEIAIEGGKSPSAVIAKLSQWISTIPTRDGEGRPIPQPSINPDLMAVFNGNQGDGAHSDYQIREAARPD